MKKRIALMASLLMLMTMILDVISPYSTILPQPNSVEASGLNNPFWYDEDMWNKRNTEGGKNYVFNSGRRLTYDIYQGGDGRIPPGIENRSDFQNRTQPYLTFEGWAANVGHAHHTAYNQRTHIVAKNPNTGKEYMFNTTPRPGDATKDVEFNKRKSTATTIYKPCPTTSRNQEPSDCNMWYPNVGFKAFVPLETLFPEDELYDGMKWELYLTKKVENNVVTDGIRMPVTPNDMRWKDGRLSFTSGIDSSLLTMTSRQVLRYNDKRHMEVNQTLPTNQQFRNTYFVSGSVYRMQADNQTGTAIWYGVASHHDAGKTRWNASIYWRFGGDIATLTYHADNAKCPDGSVIKEGELCDINVTIYHKDVDTGQELGKETFKIKEGTKYRYTAKEKGYFKKGELDYFPTPAIQVKEGVAKRENITHTFNYRAELEELPPIHEGTPPSIGGDVLWRLYKPDVTGASRIRSANNLRITGSHYAIREGSIKWTTRYSRSGISKVTESPHTIENVNADAERNGSVMFQLEYFYTNYSKSVCTGTDSEGNCTGYKQVPDWDRGELFVGTETLAINHVRGDKFEQMGSTGFTIETEIGRSKSVGSSVNIQKERLVLPDDGTKIDTSTQVAIPIMKEPYKYDNDFREKFYHIDKNSVNRFLWVDEMDRNFVGKYDNPYYGEADKEFAIPVEIDEGNVQQEGSKYIIPVISTDAFYTTRNTGFVFSAPRNVTGSALESLAGNEYKAFTGANYRDKLISVTEAQKSSYYMPIEANFSKNKMLAGVPYTQVLQMGRMGLNDITVKHDRTIMFQRYLVGSVFDDTWVVEQHDPTVNIIDYPYSVKITQEDGSKIKEMERKDYIHSYRSSDGIDFYDVLRGILNLPNF